MAPGVAFTLPHGVNVGGEWRRDAHVRSLTGAEEELLGDSGAGPLPAERTTELLAGCVKRIGAADASTELVRGLTVGDREALLLEVRRLTFGERIDASVTCPSAACGERLDLELGIGDLLLQPYEEEEEWQEASVSSAGSARRVRYRAPTGGDQEDAARLAPDLGAATRLVTERCARVAGADGEPLADVPDDVAEALPELLARRDPQAEIVLSLTCPACKTPFRVLFDAGEYLHRELASDRHRLLEEIHSLALHYHWGEAEIMAMPTGRRRRYLELLADAVQPDA